MNIYKRKWYSDGLRFACLACGECCRDHGEYTFVYLVKEDISAMASALSLTLEEFWERYCVRQKDGLVHLQMSATRCPFLKEGRCILYHARPKQCRTWPFWNENLVEKTWFEEVLPFCRGAGQGKLFSQEEIESLAALEEDGFDELP